MPQGKESGMDKEGEVEPSRAIPTIEDPPRSFVPKAPYPERLRAPKKNAQFAEIMEVFKQVQINIPFLDAIQQVPSYAKFLKDLVTVKRKNNVPKKAFLTEQVSSILQCKLPIKYPWVSNHFLQDRNQSDRKGTVGSGCKCESPPLFSLSTTGVGRIEAHFYDTPIG
jgi:hypothetical protein